MIRCKLGEILKVKHGYAFKSENYGDSHTTLITLANISDKNTFQYNPKKATHYCGEYPLEFNLQPGDLIIPLTEQVIGLFGNSAIIPNFKGVQFVLNQRVGKIIPIEGKADLKFLHYLLATELVKNQLESKASAGTKQRNISPEDIYDVLVEIPDLPEQEKIGQLLYSLEYQININEELATRYREYIDFLYDRWFLQYQFPNKDGKPYKTSGGKFKLCEMITNEIPVEWQVKTLKNAEAIQLISSGIDYFHANKKYLATADVDNNDIKEGSLITHDSREGRANMQPVPFSVWFAKMKNSIKHIAVCKDSAWLLNDYIFSTGFMGFKCTENFFGYFYAYINNSKLEQIKDMRSSGSTQESINDGDLGLFPIVVPDDETCEEFSKIVNPIISTIDRIIVNTKYIEQYMKYFLPKMLKGQINLGD